jgi:hypothetical protein
MQPEQKTFRCPHCGKQYMAPSALIGKTFTHGCGVTITVGASQAPAAKQSAGRPHTAAAGGARAAKNDPPKPTPTVGQRDPSGGQPTRPAEKATGQAAGAHQSQSTGAEDADGLPRWFWVAMAMAILFFAGLGVFIVRSTRENARQQLAAQTKAEFEKKLEEARQALAQGRLADAERLVGEVATTSEAVFQEQGRAILADVAARRALADANKAIAANRFDEAKSLLEGASTSGLSAESAAALKALLEQLAVVTSPERVTELAKSLTESELSACLERGELPPGKRLENTAINARLVAEVQSAIDTIRVARDAERKAKEQAELAERRRSDIGRQFVAIEPAGGTYRMAVSADGRLIASLDAEKNRVYIQSSEDGAVVANMTPPAKRAMDFSFSTCCLSADGAFVAAVVPKEEGQYTNVPVVVVWDVANGRVDGSYTGVKESDGFTDYLDAIALTKEHVIAAATGRKSGEEKSFVRVWDRASSKLVHSFAGHRRPVKALAVHAESGLVATGGEDRVVIVWDAGTGREVAVLDEHESEIEAVAFSPDGTQILSGGFECSVRLWDIAGRKRLAKWQLGLHDAQEEAKMRMAQAQHRMQSTIDALSGNARVSVSPLSTWPYPRVSSVAFSRDGGRVAVGLQAIAPQTLKHTTNPVLIDLKSGEVVPLPTAFQAEPLSAVNAVFVRDGNAIMFNKVIRERIRGEVQARTVLSVTGIP